jgi:hypothetical protein
VGARPFDWRGLTKPSYLRFAIPGLILLFVAALFWGSGWWVHATMLVGLALIIFPMPRPEPPTTPEGRERQPRGRSGAAT